MIRKIVIKYRQDNEDTENGFVEKLTISKSSVKYKYIPNPLNSTEAPRRWHYHSESLVFRSIVDEVMMTLPKIISDRKVLRCDQYDFMISFKIESDEGTEKQGPFKVQGNEWEYLFSLLKGLVPDLETMPLFLASQDYEHYFIPWTNILFYRMQSTEEQCPFDGKGTMSTRICRDHQYMIRILEIHAGGSIGRNTLGSGEEFIYVIKGIGRILCEDSEEKLKPGLLHIRNKGGEHEIINTGKDDLMILQIRVYDRERRQINGE